MKRLNPATGKPFEVGDRRWQDHKRFLAYSTTRPVKRNGFYTEVWSDIANYNLLCCLRDCKRTAVENDLPFDIDMDYLLSIKTDCCPVFGTPFSWERIAEGYDNPLAPSLDKIKPELGYVKGNVVFISIKANRIKSNADDVELRRVADWLKEERKRVTDAFKDKPAPLPISVSGKSKDGQEPRTLSTTGAGQDDNNPDHHSGTVRGQDVDHSPQTSSGDRVGYGVQEMGTPNQVTRLEDHGQPDAEIVRLEFGSRHLPD